MRKILIVEDEEAILSLLKAVFEDENYEVYAAKNGVEGLEKFKHCDIDLVLTDVMMPLMDGYEMSQSIREIDRMVPIVMLTALSEDYDQIKAFELEIDDFISKPYSFEILKMRINNIFRRSQIHDSFEFENIFVDFDAHFVRNETEQINLTAKEFSILHFLINNRNRVISREEISDAVWGPGYYGDLRNIDTHIKNIRRKLQTEAITTVKGVGYNFKA